MGGDWLSESERIGDLGERMERLIEASDFGPNSNEVLEFLGRLETFQWEDWRALQRAYLETLEMKITPALKVLDQAAAAASLTDQFMAAGWAASKRYPTHLYQTRPPDINPELCSVASMTAARAVAARTLIPEESYDRLFRPFAVMKPMRSGNAGRPAGCGAAAVICVILLVSMAIRQF